MATHAGMDITALGEALIDFGYEGSDAAGYPLLQARPGGAPANFLAAAAAMGRRCAMIAKVGADSFGRLLLDTLERAGVCTDGAVCAGDAFTTLAFVTLDPRGEREFSFARKPGADTLLRPEELDEGLIKGSRLFHFGSLSLTDEPARSATERALALAREAGAAVSFDPNYRPPLWRGEGEARERMLWGLARADVVKLSAEEAAFLWGCGPEEGARRVLVECGAKLVFVTCGARGAYYANRLGWGFAAAPRVRPVDTTGAGDIFGGTAAALLLESGLAPEDVPTGTLGRIARAACAAASLSTERRGGISSVPGREAVLAAAREERA